MIIKGVIIYAIAPRNEAALEHKSSLSKTMQPSPEKIRCINCIVDPEKENILKIYSGK